MKTYTVKHSFDALGGRYESPKDAWHVTRTGNVCIPRFRSLHAAERFAKSLDDPSAFVVHHG